MAKTTPEKLTPLLKSLAPVYLVCGDETLLVQEAADAIRTAARKQGFTERERYYSDAAGMQWQNILLSANSLGLFGDSKIIFSHQRTFHLVLDFFNIHVLFNIDAMQNVGKVVLACKCSNR